MKSLRGHLLIASPELPDPNFCRSVVLIIDHDTEGAFGLILNRTTTRRFSEFWESDDEQLNQIAIAVGGPVPGPILVLHADCGDDCADQIISGVCLTKVDDDYAAYFREAIAPYRVFVGYAGWGGGQLEAELDTGSWLTLPATSADVFEVDEGKIWDVLVTRAQLLRTKKVLRVKNLGDDPSLN
ncbi:MAG: YqgE/AlgH family protein [Planctomycetales bacterium]|nr:YqgE/AlgH family protein [Planctomycetales bacterium]